MPPAATRAAVSRADARSRTFRTSLKPYFSAPARSAWPGRTRVTGVALLLPSAADAARLRGVVVGQALDLHDRGPVLPVPVGDEEEDRRAERHAVADAGDDVGGVVLDRLAGAAPVAALAAGEVDRQLLGRQGEPGRHALDDHAERSAVRFAGRQPAQATHPFDAGPSGQPPPGRPDADPAPAAVGSGSPVGSPSAERTPRRGRSTAPSASRRPVPAGPSRG